MIKVVKLLKCSMITRTICESVRQMIKRLHVIFAFPKAYIDWKTKYVYNFVEDIFIANGVRINSGTVITAINTTKTPKHLVKIGANTYIGENNILRGGAGISIGEGCLISNNVVIISENHSFKLGIPMASQASNHRECGVIICDDVWIGANSVILPHVTLGKGCVIGAGSIVTKSIPENAIAFGNPAKVVKYRE